MRMCCTMLISDFYRNARYACEGLGRDAKGTVEELDVHG